MYRLFFCVLMLLPIASIAAQEKKTLDPPENLIPPELGASTDKARLVLNPPGHVYAIQGLFFRLGGQQLVSVGVDRTVQFWDVLSGERIRVLRLPLVPTAAALSPDGRTLALGREGNKGDRRILLLNLRDERIRWLSLHNDHGGGVPALAFSPSGDQLAMARDGAGKENGAYVLDGMKGIWDKTAQETETMRPRHIARLARINRLAFSPDCKRLAIGCNSRGKPRSAHLAEVATPDAKLVPSLSMPIWNRITDIAWSPDGKEVVTTDQNYSPVSSVKFFSATDGTLTRTHPLGWLDGSGLHFLSAKELLLTWYNDGSAKKGGPNNDLTGLGHGQSILRLDNDPIKERRGPYLKGAPDAGACRSALSPDGKIAAFTGGSTMDEIVIWEPATGKQLHHLGGKLGTPRSVGWSKDGKSLGLGDFRDKDKDKDKDKKDQAKAKKKAKVANPFFQHALNLESLQISVKADRADYLYRYRTNGDWSLKITKLDFGMQDLLHKDELVRKMGPSWGISPGGIWVYLAGTLSPTKDPKWFAHRMASVELAELPGGKAVQTLLPKRQRVFDLAPSPDGRYLISVNDQQVAYIYRIADDPAKTDPRPLLYLFVSHGDWIMWTKEGYYAASPGGERIMGWSVDNGPDKLPTFYPAERFRKPLHRPDVIKLVFETGNVASAVEIANRKLKIETRDVTVDRLLPPRVIGLTVDDSKLPLVKIKVRAEASSKDQPITALRLKMDGRVVPGAETLTEFKKGTLAAEIEWSFKLPDGDHHLSVLARGPDSSSNSHSVLVKNINQAKLPVLHVLAIGVNNYKDESLDLLYAVPDAEALARAFAVHCKGQPFRDVKTHTLLNKQATRKGIADQLEKISKDAQQQDLVVVFFAGHGVKEQKEYFLLTHEANASALADTALSGTALRKSLRAFKCQVLLMLDACQSAGFGEGKLAQRGLRPAVDDVVRDLTDDEYGIAVLCAAMGSEKAEGAAGHGLFTRAILEALEKKPGVPVPFNRHNQRVYVHHLHSYVFDEVSARSDNRQHPFLSLPWIVEPFVVR